MHTDGESHAVGGDVLKSLMISAVEQNHYCGSFHALSLRNFGPEKLSNHGYILLVFQQHPSVLLVAHTDHLMAHANATDVKIILHRGPHTVHFDLKWA